MIIFNWITQTELFLLLCIAFQTFNMGLIMGETYKIAKFYDKNVATG